MKLLTVSLAFCLLLAGCTTTPEEPRPPTLQTLETPPFPPLQNLTFALDGYTSTDVCIYLPIPTYCVFFAGVWRDIRPARAGWYSQPEGEITFHPKSFDANLTWNPTTPLSQQLSFQLTVRGPDLEFLYETVVKGESPLRLQVDLSNITDGPALIGLLVTNRHYVPTGYADPAVYLPQDFHLEGRLDYTEPAEDAPPE